MHLSLWITPLLAQADAAKEKVPEMTVAGWLVMSTSIAIVLALFSFCLIKVLMLPPVEMEDIKGPLEIDTRDTDDPD